MKVLHVTRTLPQEMLGPMYLSRAVKDAGHDMRAVCLPDPRWLSKIREYQPDVITWSLMTGNHRQIFDVNRFLKSKFDFFSLMGGPHVTFVPESAKEAGVDALCIGEGEQALVELLDRMEQGRDWRDVENLAWADGDGEVHKNPLRPLVRDLDELGFPDRSLIYDAQPLYRNSPRKVMLTQRGCPMLCTFCFHHAWKNKIYKAKNSEYVRKRSVDHVIAEALRGHARALSASTFVHFLDDIFNLKSDWLAEFCERWPREVGPALRRDPHGEHDARGAHRPAQGGRLHLRAHRIRGCERPHPQRGLQEEHRPASQLHRCGGLDQEARHSAGIAQYAGRAREARSTTTSRRCKLNVECGVDHPLVFDRATVSRVRDQRHHARRWGSRSASYDALPLAVQP